jgi:plasmid stabilization system protein ParE
MVNQVTWTKRANSKFNSIIAYLEKKSGSKVTENFVRRTYDIIELIRDQPEIGTLENRENNIRGFNVTRHNRMFTDSLTIN